MADERYESYRVLWIWRNMTDVAGDLMEILRLLL